MKRYIEVLLLCFVLFLTGCGDSRTDLEKLTSNPDYQSLFTDRSEIRFTYFDLDGDDKLEIACSDGDYHASGVAVFKVGKKDCVYLGTFGTNGKIQVSCGESVIHSQYGNHGAFYDTYSKVTEVGNSLIYALYTNDRESGIGYYAITDDSITGDHSFDYLLYAPKMEQISEEEYTTKIAEIKNMYNSWSTIQYSDMKDTLK